MARSGSVREEHQGCCRQEAVDHHEEGLRLHEEGLHPHEEGLRLHEEGLGHRAIVPPLRL